MSTAQTVTALDKLRTRGHWQVAIRPKKFDEVGIPYADLPTIVERNAVGYRGWRYPYVNHRTLKLGPDWIGQECDDDGRIEVWRFHANGLFAQQFALWGDWADESRQWPAGPGWRSGALIEYLDTISTFVEIFEFAARLAQSPAGSAWMHVEIRIAGLEGRRLVSEGTHFRARDDYRFSVDEWTDRWDGTHIELMAGRRELAARSTREFLARCGVNVSTDVMRLLQERISR